MHEDIIEKLYQEYTVRGFISEDHIFDVLEENGISLFDVEYICDHLLSKGVIIRDDALTGVSDGIGIEKVQLVELNGLKILHKTSLRIDLLRLSFF